MKLYRHEKMDGYEITEKDFEDVAKAVRFLPSIFDYTEEEIQIISKSHIEVKQVFVKKCMQRIQNFNIVMAQFLDSEPVRAFAEARGRSRSQRASFDGAEDYEEKHG